jgi:hypothetical protein
MSIEADTKAPLLTGVSGAPGSAAGPPAEALTRTALMQELGRALELVDATVVDFKALHRRDYDTRGRYLGVSALVVRCQVSDGENIREAPDIVMDANRRPMTEEAATFLGAIADAELAAALAPRPHFAVADETPRGDYIYRTVS